MTDQEILDNAPEGATHVSPHKYSPSYFKESKEGYDVFINNKWDDEAELCAYCCIRSLADIRELVQLRAEVEALKETLSKCERVIRVPDNENTAHNYDLKP